MSALDVGMDSIRLFVFAAGADLDLFAAAAAAASAETRFSERRGGFQRRQMELKGAVGGY
jgi:hypothetical protein